MDMNILALEDKLVGPYSIIRNYERIPSDIQSIPLNVYVGHIGLIDKFFKKSVKSEACGASFKDEIALASMLGEAVERYSWLSISDETERVKLTSEDNLSDGFISLRNTGLLLREDLTPDDVFDKLRSIRTPWLTGKNVKNKKAVLIPVIDLFPNLLPNDLQNSFIRTTNGIAVGMTFEDACLRAIYEIIERDAVMQFWYGLKSCRCVYDIQETLTNVKQLLNKYQAEGIKIYALDISTHIGIHCIFTFIYRDQKDNECFTCGAACRISEEEALEKSYTEAAAMWNSLPAMRNHMQSLSVKEASSGFKNINSFEDHVLLYSYPWAKKGYEFILSNVPSFKKKKIKHVKSSKNILPADELDILLRSLGQKGYEVYAIDITPQDIKYLGLFVVKTVIPGLIPLFVGKYNAFYVNSKLEKAIISKSYNLWPHPLP